MCRSGLLTCDLWLRHESRLVTFSDSLLHPLTWGVMVEPLLSHTHTKSVSQPVAHLTQYECSMENVWFETYTKISSQECFATYLENFQLVAISIAWCSRIATPCGRGTVTSIVYCRCTYWCPETNSSENNLTLFTILCCVILLWAQVWTVIHTSWAWC